MTVLRPWLLWTLLCLLLCPGGRQASAQSLRRHPGRGAVSTQDLHRLTAKPQAGSAAADSVCARYAAGSQVSDPPVLSSQNGVLEFTLNFFTVTDSQGLVRYCYLTSTGQESPTLVVNPGDQLIIHFQNSLPAGAASDSAAMNMTLSNQAAAGQSAACNGAMGANVTNIHFHGTNIPPVCGQDEVIHTLVQPGQSFTYSVTIPATEPPGLYWYHPHPHGISEGQVQGGATGAIIVNGLQNVFPSLAGMPTRTFVLRDQLLPASEANDANIPAWDLSLNFIPVTYPGYTPAVVTTPPAEQELWRIANTAADTILNLQYLVNGVAQPMHVYAIDGYPVSSGAGATETTLQLGPGARAEVVVTTPASGETGQLVTQYQNTGPDGDYDPTRPIASIVSSPTAPAPATIPTQSGAANTTLAQSLAGLTPAAHRNLYFSEVLQNPANPDSPTTFYITAEGQTPAIFTMDQPPNIVVHAGTVEDWTVENRAQEDHIFHIHQLHFQVLAIDGQPVNDPALRDTMDIPYWSGSGPYHSITVRMDFSDPNVIGTFVYHCHILEHEDGGMMGEIQVLPAGAAAAVAVSASTASIAPQQSITLTANVSPTTANASTPTGLVQFQVNGQNVGAPTSVAGGVATLTTPVNGNTGANTLTALYEGDTTYDAATSPGAQLTVSPFALTASGVTSAIGTAAQAQVAVNAANNYTGVISLSCALPSSLKEAACFVNPGSITGAGTVQLTVNSTPSHPVTSRLHIPRGWALGGGTALACVVFLIPGRKRRGALFAVLLCAGVLFAATGCSGSGATDSGTTAGTYAVVLTATGANGSSTYQSSVTVPVTLK